MVKYTLNNIEGIIFQHCSTLYKIYKSKNQMEHLNGNCKGKTFEYTYWQDCINCLNNGSYKVINKPIYELW